MNKYSSLIFIFILSFLATGIVSADTFKDSIEKGSLGDTRLVLNVASKHIGADGTWFEGEFTKFNEKNYGLGLEQDFNREGTITGVAGFYKDSFNTTAFYVGGTAKKWLHKYVAVGVTGGVTSSQGYNERGYTTFGVLPTFGPVLTLTNGTFGVNLSYMPVGLISKEVTGIYALQFTMKMR